MNKLKSKKSGRCKRLLERIVRRKLGNKIRKFAEWIMPNYWVCTHCGCVKYKEEEVTCWQCGIGEMIYKGDCA